jgi:hypothetical protein
MRHAKTILVLITAAIVIGLGYRVFFSTPKEFRQVDVAEYESEMTEALLRGILQDIGTNGGAGLFLAFGHRLTSPTDAFLEKFSGHVPPVRSYAASSVSPTGDILDATSGNAGVMIQIAKIERKSDGEFDVEAAMSNLPASSNRFLYTLVQRDGEWVVRSRKAYEGMP